MTQITKRFTVEEGWRPMGERGPALLDCQNERPVPKVYGHLLVQPQALDEQQKLLPPPAVAIEVLGQLLARHPLLLAPPRIPETPEEREARIRLNPATATAGDVLFLVCRLEEARAEQAEIVARMDSNCAVAAAIDVEAWLSARQPPRSDWISAIYREYVPPA